MTQSWTHAAAALATAATARTGNVQSRYSVNPNTISAAAPWTNPASRTSGPHSVPMKADRPAATISAKSRGAWLADDQRREDRRDEPDRVAEITERQGERAKRRERAVPDQAPRPEDDPEGDADDRGDDDVARAPAGIRHGRGRRGAEGGCHLVFRTSRVDSLRSAASGPGTASSDDVRPASFAGTSRIRFSG